MNKDINYIAALEKAISEKFGEETITHPKANWNDEKEQKYLEESRKKAKLEAESDSSKEHIDLNGVLIPKKLINSNNKRKCEYCNRYSFNRNDDVFFTKYETCYKCYVKHIEDREERWKQGWRPNKSEQI